MRDYDPEHPLIFIHVPKTGGTSTRTPFQGWFGDGCLRHYRNAFTGAMPERHDLEALHRRERPVVVYGHFNRARGFGVADYYPEARQFITVLRDPFDIQVSGFFHMRRVGPGHGDRARLAGQSLEHFLRTSRSAVLHYFPAELTMDNYRELLEGRFIEIGVTEHLDASMARIARKLGMPYTRGALPNANPSLRDEAIPEHLRGDFVERHPLEYAVYRFALERFAPGSDGVARRPPPAQ